MEVVSTKAKLKAVLEDIRWDKSVGFVPTMGAFHDGHLSLFRAAQKRGDVVVASLYVNPTQFGLGEDYGRYPRNLERDRTLAEEQGVDVLFVPGDKEIYPKGTPHTWVRVDGLEDKLCGKYRPGHFRAVATVVAKLFHIIAPDRAYFGEKDYQQILVIERMVRDLDFPVKVVRCPTARDADGVAMSSRNVYLSGKERAAAPVLHRALSHGKSLAQNGETSSTKIGKSMERVLSEEPMCKPQYVGVYDGDNLDELNGKLRGKVLLAVAAHFGKSRLVDSIALRVG